ncbi:pirin family protein [Rubritalea marina]|uniref:pirin family protein n=1 Tax=Rubritalea marina TaxID=361055 RepID=UPI00037990E8|nr:pirin family protein [Rubritalea marina]
METTKQQIQVWRSEERGHENHGWLNARHSFSFGNYYNPARMGFRSLRVINQDIIAPGMGFGMHPHRNMEIFTYMLDGVLAHKDSMGNEGAIRPGQIQVMSAGKGVQHSEFNGSADQEASLLQIWLLPNEEGTEPSYTEWEPSAEHANDKLTLLISPDGRQGSATIRQDAFIYSIKLDAGESLELPVALGRGAWLQLVCGELELNGNHQLSAGDAASTEDAGTLTISAKSEVEALFFDLN